MAFYLRAPKEELGNGQWIDGQFRFTRAAHTAMHDACAKAHLGPVSSPGDSGRVAFAQAAGQDFCWSPGPYSMGDAPDYAPTHPCYWCGEGC